jgi:hypothetical protein
MPLKEFGLSLMGMSGLFTKVGVVLFLLGLGGSGAAIITSVKANGRAVVHTDELLTEHATKSDTAYGHIIRALDRLVWFEELKCLNAAKSQESRADCLVTH